MYKKNKRIVFVTGASGFVGSNIVRALLRNDFTVHILLRDTSIPWRLKGVGDGMHKHQGDITNFDSVRNALHLANPDYIIHLAVNGAYHFQTDLNQIIKVNIDGIKNLLEASSDIPYRLFINTGSSSEYGYHDKPMKETDFCDPVSYYAATKLAVTQICKIFAKKHDKSIVTLRLFSVYGPFEDSTRLIPAINKALLLQESIQLSSGTQRRDFVYSEDVCNAYLKALELGEKISGEICNIGTGLEFSNDEVVETLFAVTKKTTSINKGSYPNRSWDTLHWRADIEHTKKVLGWKPEYSLEKGLESTYSWFKKNIDLYNN